MELLHTLAVLWLWLLAIAGVGVLVWIGWRMLFPALGPVEVTWTKPKGKGGTA